MNKVVSWIQGHKFITVLTLLTLLLSGFPLIFYGINRTFFYSIDPDVVYITNTLLYTKSAIITYADHPGTPTIMLLYYLFFPLRLIAKYLYHQNFIQWSFDNFSFLMYYCRVFELLLFCVSIFTFLKVIYIFAKSYLLVIFTWVSLFILLGFNWGMRVVPENFSFFLTAVWLIFFMKFVKTRSYLLNLILVFISGIAVANKFTSIFLAVPAILLSFYLKDLKFGRKLFRLSANVLVFFGSFLFGVLPAIKQHGYIISWVKALFFHSGPHGTGKMAIFDWPAYWSSASVLIDGYPIISLFIFLTIVLAICLSIKRKIKLNDPVLFLLFTTLVGVLVFAKYPVIHYFFVNIILMIFCTSYLLAKIEHKYAKHLVVGLMMLLLIPFNPSSFVKSISSQMIEKQTDAVYRVLEAWTPFWSADIFREQLDARNTNEP